MQLVSSQFNYGMTYKDTYVIYNTMNTTLYKVNLETFELLKEPKTIVSSTDISEKLWNQLYQDKLVVPINEDEMATAKYVVNRIIYGNCLDVMIVPTQGCNFRCIYCFENHDNNCMTNDSEKKIINFFERNIKYYKTVKISWFGGEPLLEKKRIIRIMKNINTFGKKYGVPIIAEMITNGYLLDLETFKELVVNNILYYEVTIDGFEKHHDRLRRLTGGAGTYSKIINNILNIQRSISKRFRIVIRTNVDKYSVQDYKEFREQIGKLLNYDKRFVFLVNKIVDWGGNTIKKVSDNLLQDNSNLIDDVSEAEFALNYSMATQDLSQLRCNAGKLNGFVIMPDAKINKCVKVSYNESELKEREINDLGYITDGGNLVTDMAKCAKFVSTPKMMEECNKCCWLPVCLLTMCPIKSASGENIKCKMSNEREKKLTDNTILSQYIKGIYKDLTMF